MHEEYDSIGAALYIKRVSAGFWLDHDDTEGSPTSVAADSDWVLAGCLMSANIQIGELTISERRCLSDFERDKGKGAFSKRRGSFRMPATITGALTYGPDEAKKLVQWANADPDEVWQAKVVFTDSDTADLADSTKVYGPALFQGATIQFPEDGQRVTMDSLTIPFSERETWEFRVAS